MEAYLNFSLHKRLINNRINGIYIFNALYTFSRSMISIFVPLYLYKIGYSISMILLYNILISIFRILFQIQILKFVAKLGFKHSLALSIPVYLTHLIMLQYAKNMIFFHLSWLTFSFYSIIFWFSYHSELSNDIDRNNPSKNIGTIEVLTILFSVLGPIVGGVLLQYLGYNMLLIFVSVFLLISPLPLFFTQDIKIKRVNIDFSKSIKITKNLDKNSKITFLSEGVLFPTVTIIWPLLIFQALNKNYFKYGTLITVVSILSTIVIYKIKNQLDYRKRNLLLSTSSMATSMLWFIRMIGILSNPIVLVISESFFNISKNLLSLGYFSIFYKNARVFGYIKYILAREVYLHIMKIIFLTISIFMFKTLEKNYLIPIITMFGSLSTILIKNLKEI